MSDIKSSLEQNPEDPQQNVNQLQKEIKEREQESQGSPKHKELTRSIHCRYQALEKDLTSCFPHTSNPYGLMGEAKASARNEAIQQTNLKSFEKISSGEPIDITTFGRYKRLTYKFRNQEQQERHLGIERLTIDGQKKPVRVERSLDSLYSDEESSVFEPVDVHSKQDNDTWVLKDSLVSEFGETRFPDNPEVSLVDIVLMKSEGFSMTDIAAKIGTTRKKLTYFWGKHEKSLREFLRWYTVLCLCIGVLSLEYYSSSILSLTILAIEYQRTML
jgi:hypothetical protein